MVGHLPSSPIARWPRHNTRAVPARTWS